MEYTNLKRSNPTHNLQNAFNVAEQKLGVTKLLDPEGELLMEAVASCSRYSRSFIPSAIRLLNIMGIGGLGLGCQWPSSRSTDFVFCIYMFIALLLVNVFMVLMLCKLNFLLGLIEMSQSEYRTKC